MIRVVIASRDGCIKDRVWMAVNDATVHAMQAGIACDWGTAQYPYTVAACRNRGVLEFLRNDKYDRLLFIDDDVIIPDHAITSLANIEGDVVAGCYGSVRIKPDDLSFTTAVWVQPASQGDYEVTPDGWCKHWFDGIINATAVGGGCMMIRRSILDKVGFPWFEWPEKLVAGDIALQSDDGNFCDKVLSVGGTIKAHGGVRCRHLKTVDVSRLIGVL